MFTTYLHSQNAPACTKSHIRFVFNFPGVISQTPSVGDLPISLGNGGGNGDKGRDNKEMDEKDEQDSWQTERRRGRQTGWSEGWIKFVKKIDKIENPVYATANITFALPVPPARDPRSGFLALPIWHPCFLCCFNKYERYYGPGRRPVTVLIAHNKPRQNIIVSYAHHGIRDKKLSYRLETGRQQCNYLQLSYFLSRNDPQLCLITLGAYVR